jgi:hypothetical protein
MCEYEGVLRRIRERIEGQGGLWEQRRFYEVNYGGYGGDLWPWDYCEELIDMRHWMEIFTMMR